MRVNKSPLRNKYLAISLIAIILIGALVYVVTQFQLQNFLLGEEKAEYSEAINSLAKQNFNLDLPLSLKSNGNVDKFAESVKTETNATGLRIYDPNGAVVYSAVKTEVGQNFSDNTKVKEAIGGSLNTESPTSDVSNKSILIYAPITSDSGEVRGVISARVPLDSSFDFIKKFSIELDAIIAVIVVVFGAAVYFVFASAEADMMEKDHSLVDQSKAFEEEKQLDDAIMASIAESLAVINKDGQIMLFNPEAEKLTGLQASEVEFRLYRKILNFYNKDGQEQSKNPITECLKTSQPTNVAIKDGYFLKNQAKELVPVSVSVAPILDKDKKIQGVAATIQDISVEKELDAVKDEFVYVVAHELGNPIFALDGYLSILEDESKKASSKTKDIIGSARAVNSQLSELVNDLLEVVRNEQGTLQCDVSPMNLAEIAETVVKNAQFKAKTKKITVTYQNEKIPKAMANEQKIKEVLTNFVDNAIKYSPTGTKVWVGHKVEGSELVTFVRDNGYGIKKEDQEKLFSKFYRVKTDKTANITGTGLGLFICRQIVEKCGGRVWVESEEGKGSTFYFALKKAK